MISGTTAVGFILHRKERFVRYGQKQNYYELGTVIHYDAPRTVDGFVHRSGRTAVRMFCACVYTLERRLLLVRWNDEEIK